ncbi:hypothetical protein GMRT_10350 [Giardia muris]|uniref:Uncharacterized protein n=1 Tax=Giardia muris TaxID=5742 RepID=A0A4Z1T216_GIAMU|nr:hypothetical protein GMRT_10350 [Giardia muris]|eukprot:TNJ26451.1 hypothetical protein GMRT_10350 [Giardia muris]
MASICFFLLIGTLLGQPLGVLDAASWLSSTEVIEFGTLAPNPLAEGILYGVRMLTGAQVVIALGASFLGSISEGIIHPSRVLPHLVIPLSQGGADREQNALETNFLTGSNDFYLVHMQGAGLYKLFQGYIHSAVCTGTGSYHYPQVSGIRLKYDGGCLINALDICESWTLKGTMCNSWRTVNTDELLLVVMESLIVENSLVPTIFEDVPIQKVNTTLRQGLLYFVRQFNGTIVLSTAQLHDELQELSTSVPLNPQALAFLCFFLALLAVSFIACKMDRPTNGRQQQDRDDSEPIDPGKLNKHMTRRDMLLFMAAPNGGDEVLDGEATSTPE